MKRISKTEIIDSLMLKDCNTIVVDFPQRLRHLGNMTTYNRHPSDRIRWQRNDFIDDEVKSGGFNLKEKDLIKFVNEINLEKGVKITLR